MDDQSIYLYRAYLLGVCIAAAIQRELFKNCRLSSNLISAQELSDAQMDAIVEAVTSRMEMRPEEEIQARWREQMSFIETVTERF